MDDVSYKPNHSDIARYLNSAEIYKVVRRRAEKGKLFAKSISPVGTPPDDDHPGQYKASFEVSRTEVVINDTPHATAKLENTAPYAAAVEWGYKGRADKAGRAAHHVLTRTAQFLGGSG